jgi:hypothetical protein
VNVYLRVRSALIHVQITGWIDLGLNEKAYIIPGLGDFGERRYAPYLYFIRLLSFSLGTVNEGI